MKFQRSSILLFVIGIGGTVCSGSGRLHGSAQHQDPKLVPGRVPRQITFHREQSGNPASVWDTTGNLPSNVLPMWILKKVQPTYPDSALRANLEGKVILALWIDREGNVGKVVSLLASTSCFVQPTIDAVLLWKFAPPVKDCEPLAIWVNLEFGFILEGGKPVVVTPE